MLPIAPLALVGDAASPGTTGPDLTGYLLVCAGLIGGVGLLAYAFRRLFGNTIRQRAAQRSLSVLDVLPLGGRRRLAVVRCYDRTLVLGLGEKEVALVAELDLDESPAQVAERYGPRREETFAEELSTAPPRAPRGRAEGVSAGGRGRSGTPRVSESVVAAARGRGQAVLDRIRREGVLG